MSAKIFPNASKKNPCPVCGKPDWCSFGDRAMICRRVQSDKPHFNRGGNLDGWYHFYDSESEFILHIPPKRSAPKPMLNLQNIYDAMPDCGSDLAEQMSVTLKSLHVLGVKWSKEYDAWIFPLRDGDGKIIGLNRRFKDGAKKIIYGTSGGLYISQCEPFGIPMICEGGGDAVALADMGFFAVGRFTCSSCTEHIKRYFQKNNIKRYILISQNDSMKTAPDGRQFWPGQDGAKKLKKELGLMSVIFTPPNPLKDVRDLLKNLGVELARNYINSSIGNKVWTKV